MPCRFLILPAALIAACSCTFSAADGPDDNHPERVRRIPREGIEIPIETDRQLRQQLEELQNALRNLQQQSDEQVGELLPDIMIFERAVRCALDHNEFFHEREFRRAAELLDEGLSRAGQLAAGNPEWIRQSGPVVRGYISRIDHTVQPYGLVIPDDYNFRHPAETRCDLWFHGRGETLSEVNFLWDRMHNKGQYSPAQTIVLHPYGRYSNAFKFAGETDVLEALEDTCRRCRIDRDRISVRGFSMGGAACWQFAVHYADRWFAANPGAGFSETPRFLETFQQETLSPAPWERALWSLYDCDKYAGNLRRCPTIAYSGENDRQKQAADVMAEALAARGIRLRHVIGAGMGHRIDDESKMVIEDVLDSLAGHANGSVPTSVQIETHTLKYNRMYWLTIDSLGEHWRPAGAEATISIPETAVSGAEDRDNTARCDLRVSNITALSVKVRPGSVRRLGSLGAGRVTITSPRFGEQSISVPSPTSDGAWEFSVEVREGKWTDVSHAPTSAGLRKSHNLQGPIDDAFMDSFVFVRPTGEPQFPRAHEWAVSEMNRAAEHWRRHFRGDVRIVADTEVSEDTVRNAHLVLWGDPQSNRLLAQILDDLPIGWGDSGVEVGPRRFPSSDHAPILIYPNPLNPERYVVLNSSFTFREYAYLNNARQVPMLPDWAIVSLDTAPSTVYPGKIAAADFFDESWQLKSE